MTQTETHTPDSLQPQEEGCSCLKPIKKVKRLSIAAIVLSCLAIGSQALIFATQRENPEEVHQKAIVSGYHVYAPPMPTSLEFAGEKVPLDLYYVRESLDRELISNMYLQSKMLLWLKRANRFFPVIEPILKEMGVPDDFKYLCVAESGLENVTSPAKASGYWQFLKATGQNYGLEINDEVDMRWDLESSTRAACKYLKSAYSRFGSWSAAAASYNCGEGGLSSRMTKQDAKNYYDTRLNTETGRYVYRILAIKLIMQDPQKYGFQVRHCELYPQIQTTETELKGQNVDLYQWCKQHEVSYKMLRELNPWLQTDKLANKGNKTYKVKLPAKDALKSRSTGNELLKGY